MNDKQPPWQEVLKEIRMPVGHNHVLKEPKQKGNAGLNIVLKRQIEVKRYPMIAELTFKRERQDLVSLLKAAQQNHESMPLRLMAYLKRELLWDTETAALTLKAKEVINTGYIDVKESGLYHIWYTRSDALLGTRPVMIQRDTAFFEPPSKGWKSGADARNSEFRVSDICAVDVLEEIYSGQKTKQSQQRVTLVSLQPEVLCSHEATVQLDMEWQLGLNQSLVSLKGQLETLEFSQEGKNSKLCSLDLEVEDYQVYLNGVMEAIASQFDAFWDSSIQRMVVTLEGIDQYPQAIQRFEVGSRSISCMLTPQGEFDSVQVSHLPIQPKDETDAKQWHQAWLNTFHTKNYHSSIETRRRQSQWLDHKAIEGFDLSLKLDQELLESFGRESQPEAYWHVASMTDLSPSRSKKLMLPITLMDGESLSLRELIRQLSADESIHDMIYSDRYVHTSRQSRNLNSIATCVESAEGLLMTLNPPQGKREAVLPENWERHILDKQNDNHGRYWIFVGSSHNWCWECSSGLDFIHDCDGYFTVAGTPTFTPKEEPELPHYLQDAIREMKTEGVL